jgi:translation elongation factor EF-Ts
MKFKFVILISSFLTIGVFSDVLDSYNISYEKVKIKQKSEQNSSTDKCNIYIDINGNSDWEGKKDELNTIIDSSNDCKKITIYKSISNVHTSEGNSDDDYEVNIGAIIKKNSDINIETIVIIKNSEIKDGYLKSSSNVGNVINTGRKSNVKMNNVRMKSTVIMKDSKVGSNLPLEIGIGVSKSKLSELGK